MAKTPTSQRKSPPKSKSSIKNKVKATANNSVKKLTTQSSVTPKPSAKSAASASNTLSSEGIFHRDANEYYSYIHLTRNVNKCSVKLQVGDFACIQLPDNSDANNKASLPLGKVAIKPFGVRWRPCQILSIYRSTPNGGDSSKVELRWMYRHSDLDARNRSREKNNKRELLESDHVTVMDASLLLGPLELRGKDGMVYNPLSDFSDAEVKNVCYKYYLHKVQDVLHMFDTRGTVNRGLECSKLLRQNKKLREKTYKFLKMDVPKEEASKDQNMLTLPPHPYTIQYKEGSKAFYPSASLSYPWSTLSHGNLICPLESRGEFPKWTLCVGDIVAVPCDSSEPPIGRDEIKGKEEWYPYDHAWSHAQVLAIYREVENKWKTKEDEETLVFASQVQVRIRWFNRISEAIAETESEHVLNKLQSITDDSNRDAEEIFEGDVLTSITADQILGPVRLDDAHARPAKPSPLNHYENDSPVCTFMVQNRRVCRYFFPSMRKVETSNTNLVLRGLEVCDLLRTTEINTYYNKIVEVREKRAKEMETLQSSSASSKKANASSSSREGAGVEDSGVKSLPNKRLFDESSLASSWKSSQKKPNNSDIADDLASFSVEAASMDLAEAAAAEVDVPVETLRVFCNKMPFHVDASSQKSFYDEIEVIPPLDSYDDTVRAKLKSSSERWKVKMGDTVILEVESQSKDVPGAHYPFNVAWSPVEIVSIYRVHESKDSCLKLRQMMQYETTGSFDSETTKGTKEVRVEVRWFYRSHEIPGEKKAKDSSETRTDDRDLDEVFETDHLDLCSAESILAPLVIHQKQRKSDQLQDTKNGMPCVHFHGRRYWSIHRKSFVPSGSHSSRVERGRLHSIFFGKHGTAKAALSRLGHKGAPANAQAMVQRGPLPWKEAFQFAIQTLSLAEAAQHAQLHGELTCREKERKEIFNFLKEAICGKHRKFVEEDGSEENVNIKNSIFIAGPPGTGKTASVRSVITELQELQTTGQVPEFCFIDLNGMELRNPWDSYVKFWEAISGIKKEKLQAYEACDKIDTYFTAENDEPDYRKHVGDLGRKPVTVLLLDEIDYLVTEKETVLYTFYDWAMYALPSAKLIVIGISNTINLPDRLSPKLSSRLGQKRLFFGAYDNNEIQTILKKRLGMTGDMHDPAIDVFETDAIRFAARKTANKSGDIRKAFHICKVAAEAVYEAITSGRRTLKDGARPIVRTEDVSAASRDMFHNTIYRAIACSTSYQALILIALGALMKNGRAKFSVREIRTKVDSISDASGEEIYDARLSFSDVLNMVTSFGQAGIVSLTYPNLINSFPLVGMSLSPYEINASFKNTPHSALADKHLSDSLF